MRLGSICYINSLPIDWGLLSRSVVSDHEIVQSVPATLNEKMLSGEIDLSPVSVFWYAKHQLQFYLLPDLSISSESGVQSVLLFSRKPIQDLVNDTIAVTSEGRTTPALLEILCRKIHGYTPKTQSHSGPSQRIPDGCEAMLVIGDQALSVRAAMAKEGLHVYDLAEEWKNWTGLPFVFAVWVVRRDFYRQNSAAVRQAHEEILRSKRWGELRAEDVLAEAVRRLDLPKVVLSHYFSCLSYEFGPHLREGMMRYLEEAASLGMFSAPRALEFISDHNDIASRRASAGVLT